MADGATLWPTIDLEIGGGWRRIVDSFVIVFFLEQDACSDTTPIEAAFSGFLNGIGAGPAWLYVDWEGDTRTLPPDPSSIIRQYITEPARECEVTELHLLDTDTAFPRFQAQYVHNPTIEAVDYPDKRGVIWFRLARDVLLERKQAVLDFAEALTRLLPYTSGYGSPALSYGGSPLPVPFLEQHPGFDVADPQTVAWDIGDRPLGPYWLNYFGPRLAARLGGAEGLRARLGDEFDIASCGHAGIRVVTGEYPEVGDMSRQQTLPRYCEFARVLQPLMRPPGWVYFRYDGEAQAAWHRRFFDTR